MYIVFLVHCFPIAGISTGGAGNYVANMAKILQSQGHRVTVIVEAENRNVFDWNGIEVRQITATRGFKDNGRKMPVYKKLFKNIWRSIWYNYEIYKIGKIDRIDIVQSVNTYGIPYFRIKKIPYIVRVSDDQALWRGSSYENFDYDKSLKSRRIDEVLAYNAIIKADKVIVPSYLLQDIIYQRLHHESTVIESPIVIDNYDSLQFNEVDYKPDKYFLSYGGMSYRKEIHILVQLIDDLLDRYPNMKYVMIGRNREILSNSQYVKVSDYFKKHITRNNDRFVYLGEISDRQRLFSIVKNATICVLPTRIDNLPNTVLESMALGKVIVSSTCEHGTSVEQLITDGDNGFLAQVDDAEDLYRKIVQAMELSETERILMESKAKDRVKDLTPDKVYKNMMEVYTEVIEM